MKNQNSLKWIIKNSKGEIPKIFILSISNILLALVATVLALVSKLAIGSAQGRQRHHQMRSFCITET